MESFLKNLQKLISPLKLSLFIIIIDSFCLYPQTAKDTAFNFFPLAVGNKWLFLKKVLITGVPFEGTSYNIFKMEISRDTIIQGKKYYVWNNNHFRLGDNKLFNLMDLEMDFNLNEGDTLIYYGHSAIIHSGVSSLFGMERNYKCRSTGSANYGSFIWDDLYFSDSIGISKGSWYTDGLGGMSSYGSISIVNAIMYQDTSYIYYTYYKKPIFSFTPILETDTTIITFNFNAYHEYSAFSSNGTSRNFLDKIWLEYFYDKIDSTTNHDTLYIPVNSISNNYSIHFQLNSTLVHSGYTFNYALYASDKSLITETTRVPDIGYYQLQYFPVAVFENEKEVLPLFELNQNFPNPFNSTTTFNYRILSESMITLKIFDALGNEVAILVKDVKTPGNYEIVWDAGNLPSGVYFYQLRSNNNIINKKLILMK